MKTYLSTIFPEVEGINTSELRLAFIHRDNIHNIKKFIYVPVFWAHYHDELLYCQVDYEFHFLETYDDWKLPTSKDFNPYYPGEEELSHLLQYKIKYHHVIPEMLRHEEVRLQICQWEEDIIKNWNRDKKINDLLK
jgi:hypothetical protein